MSADSGYRLFLKHLSVLTVILVLMYVAFLNLFPASSSPTKAVAIFIILFLVTAAGHYLYGLAAEKDPGKMVIYTLLSIVIKLVIYIVFAVLMILSDLPGAVNNLILFFALYVVYTVFDIFSNRRRLNAPKTR